MIHVIIRISQLKERALHSPLNIFTESLPAKISSIGYRSLELRLFLFFLNINICTAWCLNQSLFQVSVLHSWEPYCLSHIPISQREGEPCPELKSCSRRKQLSRKNYFPFSENRTGISVWRNTFNMCCSRTEFHKAMKIPFKHTSIQFSG